MFDYITYKDKHGKDEISQYIENLGKKAQTSKSERIKLKKIFEFLEILQIHGTWIGEPYVKHIDNGIWELRPLNNRIFFAYWKDNTFILLHYFQKKTQETPPRQIKQAKINLQDWLERNDIQCQK